MGVLDRGKPKSCTESDTHQLQHMLKVPKAPETHAPLGQILHKECQDNYYCLKEIMKLQKLIRESKPKTVECE